jgi:hypothetical protein
MPTIEVRVHERGRVRGDEAESDPAVTAVCSQCGNTADAVASFDLIGDGSLFVCGSCLRLRLDALSVARYRMRPSGGGIPWGKVAG